MVDSQPTLRLALLGESQTGKSHYGGQLMLRLNTKKCQLRMRGAATNISAFEEVVQRLNEGIPAAHTAASTYWDSVWPVVNDSGLPMDLTWPDYAGEQVRSLIEDRRIPKEWQERVQTADGWILMIRPTLAVLDDDLLSRPLTHLRSELLPEEKGKRSSQARIVELLQMLLYARRVATGTEWTYPALVVMVSCWDEVEGAEGKRPDEVLAVHLPMVASFIAANWPAQWLSIVGVSALEHALSADAPNENFINEGPEQFGYVVLPDGAVSKDLTLPIAELARMAAK
jgi:hypothetical protein